MTGAVCEIEPERSALAWPALAELRPHVGTLEAFLARVEIQRGEGYRLVGAFEPGRVEAAAVAGFRLAHNLAWGRHVYVDDLATLSACRRRGHGGLLLDWLLAEARRLGCEQLHLDSGHHRHEAHRVYLAHGLRISAHHFSTDLTAG